MLEFNPTIYKEAKKFSLKAKKLYIPVFIMWTYLLEFTFPSSAIKFAYFLLKECFLINPNLS